MSRRATNESKCTHPESVCAMAKAVRGGEVYGGGRCCNFFNVEPPRRSFVFFS